MLLLSSLGGDRSSSAFRLLTGCPFPRPSSTETSRPVGVIKTGATEGVKRPGPRKREVMEEEEEEEKEAGPEPEAEGAGAERRGGFVF